MPLLAPLLAMLLAMLLLAVLLVVLLLSLRCSTGAASGRLTLPVPSSDAAFLAFAVLAAEVEAARLRRGGAVSVLLVARSGAGGASAAAVSTPPASSRYGLSPVSASGLLVARFPRARRGGRRRSFMPLFGKKVNLYGSRYRRGAFL